MFKKLLVTIVALAVVGCASLAAKSPSLVCEYYLTTDDRKTIVWPREKDMQWVLDVEENGQDMIMLWADFGSPNNTKGAIGYKVANEGEEPFCAYFYVDNIEKAVSDDYSGVQLISPVMSLDCDGWERVLAEELKASKK
jgi:hypothetical protein